MSQLARANLLLFALLLAHTVDHAVNQPARDLPATGTLFGVAGFAIAAVSSVLALQRRAPAAAGAALAAGLATAAGLVAIHLLPAWSEPVSDPYWDFAANALSWALLAAPLAVSLWLGALGARGLRALPRSPA